MKFKLLVVKTILKSIYKAIDKDKNGKISKSEIVEALEFVGNLVKKIKK